MSGAEIIVSGSQAALGEVSMSVVADNSSAIPTADFSSGRESIGSFETDHLAALLGDFNQDGMSDAILHGLTAKEATIYLIEQVGNGEGKTLRGKAVPIQPLIRDSYWQIQGVGNFDNSGGSDVIWHNTATGQNVLWRMNDLESNDAHASAIEAIALPAVKNRDWELKGTADFDNDGWSDLLWYDKVTGQRYAWLMEDGAVRERLQIKPTLDSTGFQLEGSGDFDGNGSSDLLWRDVRTGQVSIWFMDGLAEEPIVTISEESQDLTSWSVGGVGDYDGDGKSDILWYNSETQNIEVWLISGAALISRQDLTIISPETEVNWQFAYDDAGRISQVTDPAGQTTTIDRTFDAQGDVQTLTRTLSDGAQVNLELDDFGRLAKMTDSLGIVNYGYDDFSRLTSVNRSDQPSIAYTYDTEDRITSVNVGGQTTAYTYDFLGRLKSMDTPAGRVSYEYLTGFRELRRTLPNGVQTVWKFEPDGNLQQLTHAEADNTILAQFTYSYRPDGLIGQIQELDQTGAQPEQKTLTYEYDQVQRLVAVNDSILGRTEYAYDEVGNRLTLREPGKVPVSSTYDWANRLDSYDGQDVSYDAAGNLTRYEADPKQRTFTYDASGLLDQVSVGGQVVDYDYDGDGNLVRRSVGGSTTNFVADPLSDIWRPFQATNASGTSTFLWEGETPLGTSQDGEDVFFLHDHLGSVRYALNEEGSIVNDYAYDSFGNAQFLNTEKFQTGFAGLFFDPETDLYLTRARGYEPDFGHFLQPDPQHRVVLGSQKDLSVYSYGGNDPINFIDNDGLKPNDIKDYLNLLASTVITPAIPIVPSLWPTESRSIETLARLIDPFIPSIAFNYVLGFTGKNLTFFNYDPSVSGKNPFGLKDRRRVLSPLTFADASLQFYWGANPNSDELFTSFDIDLPGVFKNLLGFSVYFLSEETTEGIRVASRSPLASSPRGGFSVNLGASKTLLNLPTTLSIYYPSESPKNPSQSSNNRFNRRTEFRAVPSLELKRDEYLENYKPSSVNPGFGGGPEDSEIVISPSNFSPFSSTNPSNVGGVYLSGADQALQNLGQLSGIAIDDETGEIILFSKEQDDINLPSLRLDDVVTIFRSVYEENTAPFVSIDPNPANPDGDFMLVRHDDTTDDTYVGWALFEADRIMKTYSLGKDNITKQDFQSSIPGYKNLFDPDFLETDETGNDDEDGVYERFWIVPAEVNRSQSNDKDLTLLDVPLQINTERMVLENGVLVTAPDPTPSTGAAYFSNWFTQNYDSIAEETQLTPPQGSNISGQVSPFAETERMALITGIAEVLKEQGIAMPDWMQNYQVQPVPVPDTTPRISVTKTIQQPGSILTQTIAGGAGLEPESPDAIKTQPNAPQAEALSQSLFAAADPQPLLTPFNFNHNGETYNAVVLPTDNTQAVGGQSLREVDLVVPIQGGSVLSLERSFHSFFDPDGIFGDSWTLELPTLTPEFGTFQLSSPLKTWSARFTSDDTGTLLPDNADELLPLKTVPQSRFGQNTSLVQFRDGREWYFDKTNGQLLGWKEGAVAVLYKRNNQNQIQTIEGWYGNSQQATINLSYNANGQLQSATGSNGSTVNYTYNASGQLLAVNSSDDSLGYTYNQQGLVTGIQEDGQDAASFTYDALGQLTSEWFDDGTSDGATLAYSTQYTTQGIQVTVTDTETQAKDTVLYNFDLQPLERTFEDGTAIQWQYQADGAVRMPITLPDGEQYVVTQSANGRSSSLQLPEGGIYQAAYDETGRLTELKQGNDLVLRQEWNERGLLKKVESPTVVLDPIYDNDNLLVRMVVEDPIAGDTEWLATNYDTVGRVTQVQDSSGANTLFTYDASGELTELASAQGNVALTRNNDGSVTQVTTSWGYEQVNTYGPTGELTQIQIFEDGQQAQILLDAGRLAQVKQFDEGVLDFSYFGSDEFDGQLKEITTPNGLTLQYSYDDSDILTDVLVDDDYQIQYEFDDLGQLIGLRYLR